MVAGQGGARSSSSDPSGRLKTGRPSRTQSESTLLVNQPVVASAREHEVGQGGRAAIGPVDDVVRIAPRVSAVVVVVTTATAGFQVLRSARRSSRIGRAEDGFDALLDSGWLRHLRSRRSEICLEEGRGRGRGVR